MKSLTTKVRYFDASILRDYCAALFEAAGLPHEEAVISADNLVDADLSGVSSHGVSRMSIYLKRLEEKVVNPINKLEINRETAAIASINGANGMGASVSHEAMNLAIEKAKNTGISFITVNNSNHFGTAAYYTKMALEHNMIGFSATNGAARMTPWGGRKAFFGTNPFSVAIPAGKRPPIIMDMATSVVARGKIILADKNNEKIPKGWALNEHGEMTMDPREALDGTVLPFGGPKGSAIALLIDILSGVLSSGSNSAQINDMYADFDNPSDIGHVFGAINIEMFTEIEDFKQQLDEVIRDIKSIPPAEGVEEVFLPGEIELRKREKNLKDGIPLIDSVYQDLVKEGSKYGIRLDVVEQKF